MPEIPTLNEANYVSFGSVTPILGIGEHKRPPRTRPSDLLARAALDRDVEPVASTSFDNNEAIAPSERVPTAVQKALIGVGESLRRGGKVPTSALHILLLADSLTIAQIAGRMRVDPIEIEMELDKLAEMGVVAKDHSGALARYTVIGLTEIPD